MSGPPPGKKISAAALKKRPANAPPENEPIVALDDWVPGFSNDEAEADVYDSGVFAPGGDGSDGPTLPNDITTLTSDQLGRLYIRYCSFLEFVEYQVAIADNEATEDASYLDHVEARVRLVKAGTVADKTAKAKNDERYIKAEQKSLVSKAKYKLLKARLSGCERSCNALSREMTRRQSVDPHR